MKFVVSFLCISVAAAQVAPNPCTTAAPAPPPPAPVTCGNFMCPAKMALKAEAVCAGGMCNVDTCCFENPCTTATTTLPTTVTTTPETTVTTTPAPTTPEPTTVTTTPQLTCEDFTCPAKFALRSPAPVCAGGMCNAEVCCFENPCTTGTTTIPTTVTTTPETTVTTTLPTTVTTTPAPTQPPASTAPNPCMPQVTPSPVRLFNAKEEVAAFAKQEPKQENGIVVGWALPMLGAVAMLSFAAVVGMRIRRGRRDTTRAVTLLQAVAQTSDDELEAGIE